MVCELYLNRTVLRNAKGMIPVLGYMSKGIESKILKRYLHIYVYSSILHISQEVEATSQSTCKRMGTQHVVYA